MKKTLYALLMAGFGLGISSTASAQQLQELTLPSRPGRPGLPGRQCATMDVLAAQLQADPGLAQRLETIEAQTRAFQLRPANAQRNAATTTVVTIPVVVHVLYNTAAQNISDAQVQSQIAVLNEDYSKMNADAGKVPADFAGSVANVGVQFVLAKRDPSGQATTGIIHKQTKVSSWGTNDAVKNSKRGGDDAWPAAQYLNLWACNLGQSLLGYAQFPSGAASTDGVVILYSAFGSRAKAAGTYATSYDLGRTATHEVGHWLNLRHIWGDASCGNDMVNDTPTQQTSNYGCPSYPHLTCSNTTSGDMFMNYMDYTDDACMYMFSNGQSSRMNALFAAGGARASLLTSAGGTAPTAATLVASDVKLYPNPASDVLTLTLPKAASWTVKVYDLRGFEMQQAQYSPDGQLRVAQLPQGLYQLTLSDGRQTIRQRFQKE